MASFFRKLLGIPDREFFEEIIMRVNSPKKEEVAPATGGTAALPGGRQSEPVSDSNNFYNTFQYPEGYRIVQPDFLTEVIPVIRRLCYSNPDMAQALHNIVTLGNTGHKVFFDRNVDDEQADEMRNHLTNKHTEWAPGQAGSNGLVNKMLAQLMIGGASSAEWVPDNKLSTIKTVLMVNPEQIRFRLNKDKTTYEPYQRVTNTVVPGALVDGNLKKLNTKTYQYYALNGDTELPYGIPPYMPSLGPVKTQKCMNDNIEFTINQMGLLGFLEVLIEKPANTTNKGQKNYDIYLEELLNQAKSRIQEGYKDGAVVGFKDDHEFTFHSVAKDYEKAIELYKNNELQFATALKQDASLWGRNYNTSETNITVVFMKMLSELRNMQNIIKTQLIFGYTLELRLAGYNFQYLTVEFNPSTIQDELKIQQGKEIKIRNLIQLYLMGTISEKQFADELGYEAPDQPTPRVPIELLAGAGNPADKAESDKDREDQKNKSDKKVRDKNKPVPKNK